ncbi:MAG TPA: HAD family phosphatase [Mycobacteriales bacterium]|nr:HAD family phosphatase [Mycobacteriales bacterium]
MSTQAWSRGSGPSILRGLFARRPAPTGPAAVLWDMDGLLVDTEPLWTVAEQELFRRWGRPFTPAMKASIVGNRLDRAVPMMIEFGGPPAAGESVAEISAWLLSRMVELFDGHVVLMPGAADLLDELAAARVPQALVSSSYRVLVDAVLEQLPGHPFAASVAGDEVARSKPDPEAYELAIARLDAPAARSVVLEDSPAGARAGTAAGARVVYCPSVPQSPPAEEGWRPVHTLADVSLAGLRSWLG